MNHSYSNARDCRVLLRRPALWLFFAFCFLSLTGFACDPEDDADVPPKAEVDAPSVTVGVSYGHPDHDHQFDGVGDPCQKFTGGTYRIKKIVIDIIVNDANGNEVKLYPTVFLKDGVNFMSGNPNSPIGPGTKFQIPQQGAYRIRTRIYGYPCDELPNPGECLDCCDGDPTAAPFWEEISGWHEWKDDGYGRSYVSYPDFLYCI